MTRKTLTTAMAMLSLLAIAGCAQDAPTVLSEAPAVATPSAAAADPSWNNQPAATGVKLTYDGATLNAPSGWSIFELPATGSEPLPILVAARATPVDGFAASLNILEEPIMANRTLSEQVSLGEASLRQQPGVSAVTNHGNLMVAGEIASRTSARWSTAGSAYITEQITIERDATIVTFAFPTSTAEADRLKVISGVLKSWKWS